jgi:16S rRNA (cytosine1402-N4)-methyltransferase
LGFNMAHIPVLLNEVISFLAPQSNQNFIDATVGDGGHARAILEKISPNGKLIAVDRDSDSIIRAKSNLKEFGNRVLFINDSFGNISEIAQELKISFVQGIIFDFGMSTNQLENSGKGFSFQKDEILDMRFDAKNPLTAEDVINDYSEAQLVDIFNKFGEEPKAGKIARAIVEARKKERIKTTRQLVEIIERVSKRRGKLNPATLVFQAIRIEVNKELAEIEKAMAVVPEILSSGGRAAFISFHSLEDRLIKNWSKNLDKKNIIKILNKKPITASAEEIKINPKSRSAKLRTVEKI